MSSLLERLMCRPAGIIPEGEGLRRAAVAAVFRQAEGSHELLLIRRAIHEADPWSGQVGFPGGRHESTDASLQATAERETFEETGLDLADSRQVRCLGPLDDLQARARARILPLAIRPFAFELFLSERPQLQLNEEVDSAFWVPLAVLADPAQRTWYDAHRETLPLSFPAVDLGPSRLLWGLTHHMTMSILERLGLVDNATALCIPRPREA